MKFWTKENNHLFLLLFVCFISVYYLPQLFNRLIFLGFLIAAYNSKKDYFWLVWFFIINDAPGLFFSGGEREALRIPLYSIGIGLSVSFQELFLFLYLIKFLTKNSKSNFIFSQQFIIYFILGIIVVLYSSLLGLASRSLILILRGLLVWLWIVIIPGYIKTKEELLKSSLLIFPLVFLALASQVVVYLTGFYPEQYFRQIERNKVEIGEDILVRSLSAFYPTLFALVQALFYYFNKCTYVPKQYLIFIIFTSILTVFLSATRGWMLAIIFIFIGLFILRTSSNLSAKLLRIVVFLFAIFIILKFVFPFLTKQLDYSWQRLTTLELLTEGDVTAGGTLQRIDERSPRVIGKFMENPIFGWGFSSDYFKYADGHVGNQNILLNVGIVGFVYLLGLYLYIIIVTYRNALNKRISEINDRSGLVYFISLLAMFIIHSSSTQLWGYNIGSLYKVLLWSFILTAINVMTHSDKRKLKFV